MIRAVTIRELYYDRYKPLRLAAASEASHLEYRSALNNLRAYAGHDPTLTELCDELIEGLLAWMISSGRSPATANKTRAHLLAIWRFACKRQLIAAAPDVPRLKEPQRVPRAWLDTEISQILRAAGQERGQVVPGIPAARPRGSARLSPFCCRQDGTRMASG